MILLRIPEEGNENAVAFDFILHGKNNRTYPELTHER